jgi:hypothetical protein
VSGAVEEDALMKFLLLIGALVWGMAAYAAYTAVRWSLARQWPAVPCIIFLSWTDEVNEDKPYVFRVNYRYSWAGKSYEGRTYQEDYHGSSDIAEADRLTRAFPIGSDRFCYVNPRKPSEAVLEHDNPWVPGALAIGMSLGGVFLAGIAVLSRLGPSGRVNVSMGVVDIPVEFRRCAAALTGPFLMVMGLLCYVGLFGLPLWKGVRSFGWQATPCVVRSGQVRSEIHGGLVTPATYWPDIVYRYEVDGVTYRANTYNASALGSPWYYGARGLVRRHPPGLRATCYANPADPTEAVLDRTPSGTQWFGVWPLVMTLGGAWLIVVAVTGRPDNVGTPRLWGTLALGIGTASALTILWITGSDLVRDWSAGVAEWPEYLAVAVAGVLSAGLTCGWVLLALKHPGKSTDQGIATRPPIIWDRELDRPPKAKRRSP